LAVHYVPLRVHRGPRWTLTVRFVRRPAAVPALLYRLESETAGEAPQLVRMRPVVTLRGRRAVFRIPAATRRSDRFAAPLLVVSNGAAPRTAVYRVSVR